MTSENDKDIFSEQDSLIGFPCDFPIKVMGASVPDFSRSIGASIKEIVPEFDPESIGSRKSSAGTYTALSVTVHVTSRAQLDSIYLMLTSHPLVKVVL